MWCAQEPEASHFARLVWNIISERKLNNLEKLIVKRSVELIGSLKQRIAASVCPKRQRSETIFIIGVLPEILLPLNNLLTTRKKKNSLNLKLKKYTHKTRWNIIFLLCGQEGRTRKRQQ